MMQSASLDFPVGFSKKVNTVSSFPTFASRKAHTCSLYIPTIYHDDTMIPTDPLLLCFVLISCKVRPRKIVICLGSIRKKKVLCLKKNQRCHRLWKYIKLTSINNIYPGKTPCRFDSMLIERKIYVETNFKIYLILIISEIFNLAASWKQVTFTRVPGPQIAFDFRLPKNLKKNI